MLYHSIPAIVASGHTGLVRIIGDEGLVRRGIDISFLDALRKQGVSFAIEDNKLPIMLLCGFYDIKPLRYRRKIEEGLHALNKAYSPELAYELGSLYQDFKRKEYVPLFNIKILKK